MKGGARPGSGRKPLPPEEATKPRSIRLNDADWEDARLVGMDPIRDFIRRAAKRKRAGFTRRKTGKTAGGLMRDED